MLGGAGEEQRTLVLLAAGWAGDSPTALSFVLGKLQLPGWAHSGLGARKFGLLSQLLPFCAKLSSRQCCALSRARSWPLCAGRRRFRSKRQSPGTKSPPALSKGRSSQDSSDHPHAWHKQRHRGRSKTRCREAQRPQESSASPEPQRSTQHSVKGPTPSASQPFTFTLCIQNHSPSWGLQALYPGPWNRWQNEQMQPQGLLVPTQAEAGQPQQGKEPKDQRPTGHTWWTSAGVGLCALAFGGPAPPPDSMAQSCPLPQPPVLGSRAEPHTSFLGLS